MLSETKKLKEDECERVGGKKGQGPFPLSKVRGVRSIGGSTLVTFPSDKEKGGYSPGVLKEKRRSFARSLHLVGWGGKSERTRNGRKKSSLDKIHREKTEDGENRDGALFRRPKRPGRGARALLEKKEQGGTGEGKKERFPASGRQVSNR